MAYKKVFPACWNPEAVLVLALIAVMLRSNAKRQIFGPRWNSFPEQSDGFGSMFKGFSRFEYVKSALQIYPAARLLLE
jgi:hypothetical protein